MNKLQVFSWTKISMQKSNGFYHATIQAFLNNDSSCQRMYLTMKKLKYTKYSYTRIQNMTNIQPKYIQFLYYAAPTINKPIKYSLDSTSHIT